MCVAHSGTASGVRLRSPSDETVNLHMAASCLHYGQEIFEGLKAFRGQDGKIRLFRVDENAKRLQNSALGIKMQPLPRGYLPGDVQEGRKTQ